ncbi:hypothetical protein WJX84_001247 [Apatococcus fuscideae]|uniref:Uncharacterized protein n=1 Tax=Apatococcus fuscideae TaxID=2026836 RepID=A0AAW1T240_9CHLO
MCVTSPVSDLKGAELSLVSLGPGSSQLAVADSYGSVGALRQSCQEARRRDQQKHHHKQIWTKDPHGGPYKKASNSQGYDPLMQTSDGRNKLMPLGYEKTELGPTTNFVGNHMTQGAIDLVQADLMPLEAVRGLHDDAQQAMDRGDYPAAAEMLNPMLHWPSTDCAASAVAAQLPLLISLARCQAHMGHPHMVVATCSKGHAMVALQHFPVLQAGDVCN